MSSWFVSSLLLAGGVLLAPGASPGPDGLRPGSWETVRTFSGPFGIRTDRRVTCVTAAALGADPGAPMKPPLQNKIGPVCTNAQVTLANGRASLTLACRPGGPALPPLSGRYTPTEFDLSATLSRLGMRATLRLLGRWVGPCAA